MSLIIWLPLNNDTQNQGLSNYSFTTTATLVNGGKIGKCYQYDQMTGNGTYSPDNGFMNQYINHKSFSVFLWVKCNTKPNTFVSLTYGCRLYINNNGNLNLTFYNSTRTVNTIGTTNLADDNWHHVGYTYDVETNKIKLYIDGVLEKENSYTDGDTYASSWTNGIYIGRDPNNSTASSSYFFQGRMNDVRIYNHCLSTKEIKELSKGLALHYKLDDIINPNILLNTRFTKTYAITGWDTEKNGAVAATSWGGYNSGVSNASTVYHAHLATFDGRTVYEYIKDSSNSWLGISQGSMHTRLVVGKTYTFSCKFYVPSGSANYITTGFYYRKTDATSNSFGLGLYSIKPTQFNRWETGTYTFTVPSDADLTKNAYWYVYGHSGNGKLYVCDLKLEEGDTATEWCPNASDSGFIYNSTKITDVSGYGNNGTKSGTLTPSNNSKRYGHSVKFNGTDSSVVFPLTSVITDGIFTMNCWFYHSDEWSTKGYETIFGGPSGFEIDSKQGSANSPKLYIVSSYGGGSKAYTLNEWHMLTMVRNGTDTKFYLDGTLAITGTTGTVPEGDYFIGSWQSTTQQNYCGLINDFRIYCTALSAEQIKELYQVGASIDNHGNFFCGEFIE